MRIYVVHRRCWQASPGYGIVCPHETGEGVPVAACRDRRAAVDCCRRLAVEARRQSVPWAHPRRGGEWLERDTFALARRFHDIGVRQPPAGLPEDGDWDGWWRDSADEFAPEEGEAVWEMLGGAPLFDVSEAERDGSGGGCFLVRGPLLWKDDLGSVSVHGKVPRGPDGEPFCRVVKAFAAREDAEAFARANFDPALADLNPFAPYAGLPQLPRLSSLDGPRLHDWLLDCGFPTPPAEAAGFRAWYDWWAAAAPGRPLWQRARAWQAFDRVGVSEIVEVEWAG